MKIINQNPYRIAGILSNATTKELEKQKGKVKAYVKVGREIKSDYDFQILESIIRTEDSIANAFSNMQQSNDKVNYALFWFLNASSYDQIAIDYLKIGNSEKAIEQWEKVTFNNEVNLRNFSAFNNLGTCKLLSQTKHVIKEGIEAKIKLIESDYFENFVHSVADQTFTIDNEKQIETWIDQLLTQFKNQFSSSETLQLFSGCNGTTQKYLSKKFTEEPIHNIETKIERCKKKRKVDNGNANKFGLKLVTDCKDNLSFLNDVLGITDLKYKAIADQLANEVMQCGIDYFNECQKIDSSENYLENAQKLTKIAQRIAVGKLTKDRANDTLATFDEMKDLEINQALDLLKSIKDAFEENKQNLMRQVREQQANLGYGQSINWTKVNEMINNSIDWDKASELILRVIPRKNIQKIKSVQNASKEREYKKLVEFVLDKVTYSNKNRIQYLQYWKTERPKTTSSPPRRPPTFQPTENEGIPDWLKLVGGILIFIILIKACN